MDTPVQLLVWAIRVRWTISPEVMRARAPQSFGASYEKHKGRCNDISSIKVQRWRVWAVYAKQVARSVCRYRKSRESTTRSSVRKYPPEVWAICLGFSQSARQECKRQILLNYFFPRETSVSYTICCGCSSTGGFTNDDGETQEWWLGAYYRKYQFIPSEVFSPAITTR